MKKTMLLAVCLILAGLLAVNGTFALPDISKLFVNLTNLLGETLGLPSAADENEFNVSLVYLGEEKTPQLTPGTAVVRQIAVANAENSKPAYFRLAIAVQADALPYLTLQTSGSDYTWLANWRDITIGGRAYKLMIATYRDELPGGSTSSAAMLQVALKASVTSEQLAQIGDNFLQIQVLAVDAAAFEDARDKIFPDYGQTFAEAVLDKALPITESFNPFE